ncbi:MAG: NusG domain II-containing protein [Lachnospiraceae bacterium]|nr:NusG domain II-containing protein [Lachnospiraceae bacterium]
MHEKAERKQHITRADLFFLVLCLLVAAVFAIGYAAGRREGGTLRITCDGEVIVQSSLQKLERNEKEDAVSEKVRYCLLLYTEERVSFVWYEVRPDLLSTVPEGISYNLLAVSESGVSMVAADCPDQICVHHIPITGGGESIICLPHKLAVEILGGTETETLDGMVKAESVSKNLRKEGRHDHEKDG